MTEIPHSLDAVIIAVQALIDGRPMPEEWAKSETAAPAQPVDPMPRFDPDLVAQEISRLIDDKVATASNALRQEIAAVPVAAPQSLPDVAPLMARIEALEAAAAQVFQVPAAIPQSVAEPIAQMGDVLVVMDSTTKRVELKADALEARVAFLESIMSRLGEAVHKGD